MSKAIEMVGKRFGNLVVIEKGEKSKSHRENRWLCKCDCGNITQPISGHDLRSGHTQSCGCFLTKQVIKSHTTHGKSATRLYHIHQNMKARCYNKKSRFYGDYGGRGITVCTEWLNSFETFYDWAMSNGYSDELTIDRIDNDGNYEPTNCRWATQTMQNRNTRKNVYVEINGKTQTVSQWAKETGICGATIHYRLKKGIEGEELIKPPKKVVCV